jgi:hypothetical protein
LLKSLPPGALEKSSITDQISFLTPTPTVPQLSVHCPSTVRSGCIGKTEPSVPFCRHVTFDRHRVIGIQIHTQGKTPRHVKFLYPCRDWFGWRCSSEDPYTPGLQVTGLWKFDSHRRPDEYSNRIQSTPVLFQIDIYCTVTNRYLLYLHGFFK